MENWVLGKSFEWGFRNVEGGIMIESIFRLKKFRIPNSPFRISFCSICGEEFYTPINFPKSNELQKFRDVIY